MQLEIDDKVSGLDSKLDAILQSINNQSRPSAIDREAQLDQLISLWLKHTIEEVEHKYDTSVDHYLETITNMLKVHDDLVAATNDLIKKTHVGHEKQIQRLGKEIRKKDGMNLIMQQVLLKLIKAAWHIVDVPNHKFDEMILILE